MAVGGIFVQIRNATSKRKPSDQTDAEIHPEQCSQLPPGNGEARPGASQHAAVICGDGVHLGEVEPQPQKQRDHHKQQDTRQPDNKADLIGGDFVAEVVGRLLDLEVRLAKQGEGHQREKHESHEAPEKRA